MKNYVMNKSVMAMVDNKLQMVDIKGVNYDCKGEIICYLIKVGDAETTVKGNAKFYADESCFKEGKHIEASNEPRQSKLLSVDDDGLLYVNAWIMQNGEPNEKRCYVRGFYVQNSWSEDGFNSLQFEEYSNEDVYQTREDCLAYNDYQVVEDGEVKTRVGIAKLIALTDEQKELVDKFVELTNKMKENGINFVVDNEDQDFGFYNTSNIDDSYVNYEDPHDGYEEYNCSYVDWSYSRNIPCIWRYCDYSLYVKK